VLTGDGDSVERTGSVQEAGGSAREAKTERTSVDIKKGTNQITNSKMSKP
jgi:hypothetical protein